MSKQPQSRHSRQTPAKAGTSHEDKSKAKSRGGFSDRDSDEIEDSSRLSAPIIYEILRREGEEEMSRPATSLWWSGIAAGLSISFSLLAQAFLQSHLPATPWRPLVTDLGYTVGFLIAVLARHQLFTENTITVVLPVAKDPTLNNLWRLGRLWGLVLVANFVGTLLAALFCSFTPVVGADERAAMLEISRQTMANTPIQMFCKAIVAGFLIAGMVWLLPSAGPTRFHVVVLLTYVIALGGFTHIIAGSFEAFMLVANGQLQVSHMILGFLLPALLGNIVGGTFLFSLISYGQVADEI